MAGEVAVQTRVPRGVAQWAAARAQQEGRSVANWLRKLVVRESMMQRTDAWFVRVDDKNSDPNVFLHSPPRPHTIIEILGRPNTTVIYAAMVHVDGGEYMTDAYWLQHGLGKDTHKKRVILRGSSQRYKLVASVFDSTAGRMHFTLSQESSEE